MDTSNIFTDDSCTLLLHESVPYKLRNLASALSMSGGAANEIKAEKLREASDIYVQEALRQLGKVPSSI